MQNTPASSFLRLSALVRSIWLCLGLVAAGLTAEEPAGAIAGRVVNASTGAYLEGASVTLQPTGARQLTSREGEFRFIGLAAGEYTVSVTYPDLDAQSRAVVLTPGGSQRCEFELNAEVYQLKEFVVTGEREGNAAAIVAQKNAPNVTNTIAIDAFGSVADGNIGNFLQRLPGVDNAFLMNGEIQGFGVRGMPQGLSTVSLDGAALASANAAGGYGDRSFPIDVLPAELIDTVKLTKSPTPDMPADSLGGNVNLVSKSAFALRDRRFTYRVGLNNNLYRGNTDWTPTGAFTLIDRFGADRSWGITFSGSFSRSLNTQERIDNTLHHVRGDTNVNDPIIKTRVRLIDGSFKRDRTGTSLKLEKRIGDRFTWRIDGTYTVYDYDLQRNDYRISGANQVVDYAIRSRDSILAGGDAYSRNATNTASIRASIAPNFTESYQEILDATFQNYATGSTKKTDLFKVRAGGDLTLDAGWLKFEVSQSRSSSDYEIRNFYAQHARKKGVIIDEDAGSPELPLITELYNTQTGTIFAGSNLSAYTSNQFSINPQNIVDETGTGTIDWQHQFTQAGPLKYVQAGASWRTKDYVTSNNLRRYTYNGGSLASFLKAEPSVALFDGYYPAFDQLDLGAVGENFHSYPAQFVQSASDVVIPASTLTENVASAYVMGGFALQRLSWLMGARFEQTEIDGVGSMKFRNQATYSTITRSSKFDDWFPGAHFRYNLRDDWIFRASWSKSMGRPSIAQQVPATTIIFGPDPDGEEDNPLGTIIQNNINLRPMYADNFDVSLEHYFQAAGVLSFGVFQRDIDGYIATVRTEIPTGPDNGWDGLYEGFTYRTQMNLSAARVRGFEFNYNQALTFLPGIWRGLSLNANFTRQEASGNFDEGQTELPGFKDTLANAGLTFRYRKAQIRVNYNYNSGYLSEYSTDPILKTFTSSLRTVDLNLQLTVNRRMTFFIDVNNLFDDAPRTYIISPEYNRTYERNGTRVSVGFTGRL